MSQDNFTVSTSVSWFSRLGSAIKGVVAGFALLLAAVLLLGWNEGRSIQSIRSNNEGAKVVVSVGSDRVDPANEGRLVHLSAPASAEGLRQDTQLGVQADGLLLMRTVEYFQWAETASSETRTKLGGGQETVTTYNYATEWSSMPNDSDKFNQPTGHQNPAVTVDAAEFAANSAALGAFRIDEAVLGQLSADTLLPLTAQNAQSVSGALSRPATLQDKVIYIGTNPASPQVGDMKISYRLVPQNTTLSVIGAQVQNTLRPFPTKAGSDLLMVRKGTASSAEMFQAAKAANQTLSWVLRGVGIVLAITAFGMILGPLGVLGDVVPLIGSIIRTGTGLIAGLLGVALGLIVIAISWIAFRPLLGLALLAVAGALVASIIFLRRKKAAVIVI